MRRPRWPQGDVDDLREMAGKRTVAEIAEWLGRSVSAVHAKACNLGVPLALSGAAHHKALYSEEQRAQVVELRGLGWMFKDIAQLLGMTSPVTAAKIWYAHERAERAEREVPSE